MTKHEQIAAEVLRRLEEGTLARYMWWAIDAQGREMLCLLATISPEVAEAERVDACPAETMVPWLARLTPLINDSPSAEQWPQVIRRFAAVVARYDRCDDWASVERDIKALCEQSVLDALRGAEIDPTFWGRVKAARSGVIGVPPGWRLTAKKIAFAERCARASKDAAGAASAVMAAMLAWVWVMMAMDEARQPPIDALILSIVERLEQAVSTYQEDTV